MSECSSVTGCERVNPRKLPCPLCAHESSEVTVRTIVHHLGSAWAWRASAHRYFFCADPACAVVYFGDDGSSIKTAQLRTRVGLKERSGAGLLCYCFGVTRKDFEDDPATRAFVVAQTAKGWCSCETSNPSGRCCLKDFPGPVT